MIELRKLIVQIKYNYNKYSKILGTCFTRIKAIRIS